MVTLNLGRHEVAAVGDSPRDASLLRAAGHSFYVGPDALDGLEGLDDIQHYPDGDIAVVARAILRV
jgi:phosphoserine phosphatase